MKRLKSILAALLLVILITLPATALTDLGTPELTRIWAESENDDAFTCTASYIFPYIGDNVSYIVTAGHCKEASLIKRNVTDHIAGIISWKIIVNTHGEFGIPTTDLAIGVVPDVREKGRAKFWLADKAPERGRVYIHGFPAGIERVSIGLVVPVEYHDRISFLVQTGPYDMERRTIPQVYPGTRLLLVKPGEITGGSSGSPILNDGGRIVGILWGLFDTPTAKRLGLEGIPEGYELAAFTPIERLHELRAVIGIK